MVARRRLIAFNQLTGQIAILCEHVAHVLKERQPVALVRPRKCKEPNLRQVNDGCVRGKSIQLMQPNPWQVLDSADAHMTNLVIYRREKKPTNSVSM